MSIPLPPPLSRPLWHLAQATAMTATLALIAALFIWPDSALSLLWDVAIPILPAVFLINPSLWRNICPLANLNTLSSRLLPRLPWQRRRLSEAWFAAAGGIGIALLLIMVPARRFVFNTDGPLLGITVLAVAALALVMGLLFERKAGFCNSLCPVLPVERLYGQQPLVKVANAHCKSCVSCVSRGCVDLAASKALPQTLGSARHSHASHATHAWLLTLQGAFIASFPGFVLGYYLLPNGPWSSAGRVYGVELACMLASWLLCQLVVRLFHLSSATASRLLAALALAIYYWFVAAVVSDHLTLPAVAVTLIRGAALLLIAYWWQRHGHSGGGGQRRRSVRLHAQA